MTSGFLCIRDGTDLGEVSADGQGDFGGRSVALCVCVLKRHGCGGVGGFRNMGMRLEVDFNDGMR